MQKGYPLLGYPAIGYYCSWMAKSLHRAQYDLFRKMLVDARTVAGLTQVEVATGLGRPQSFVSKYERGDRRLDFTEFVEIAGVLGIDISEFLGTYQEGAKRTDIDRWLR